MDSDGESEQIPSFTGLPGTVILINAFDPQKSGSAEVAHAAVCLMLKQYFRSSKSDHVGVCLFGTENGRGTSNLASTSVTNLLPLTVPTLDDFIQLRSINIASYRQAKDLNFSDALWHCSKMFANCKKQLLSRTLFIMTRLDTPPISADQKPTLKRLADLVDSNIEIEIINVSDVNNETNQFYEHFLKEANKGNDFVIPQPVWNSHEIAKLLIQESHRHLAIARMTFNISQDVSIGVGIFNLLKGANQNLVKKVNLDSDTNTVLTSATKTEKACAQVEEMDVDGEEIEPKQVPLLKSELLHYQEFGGERIEFGDSEMKILRNPFGPPMLKLLGFKPASVICKEKWFIKGGYFLFPSEKLIEGSTVAFKALYQACSEMSVVAVCVLCTRVNSRPKIVALSPSTKPLGLRVDIGFDVILIPFVENVRDIKVDEDEESTQISEAHKSIMKKILNKLKFDYRPDMFENPKLQSEYRAVEAIALEDDDLEPFEDKTKPTCEMIQDLNEDLFEEIFGPFNAVAFKRVASKEGGPNNKKTKVDENSVDTAVTEERVHEYTVSQLRDILKSVKPDAKLPPLTGLKKNQLVDLVYKYSKQIVNKS